MMERMSRVVLGLFVVWQLVFLFASNILSYRSNLPGSNPVLRITSRWQQLTGQRQGGWAQFSPGITRTSAFLAVRCVWPDREPVMLRSEVEPSDPNSYVQWPTTIRLANYESTLSYMMWHWNRDMPADERAEYRQWFAGQVRGHEASIRAYLSWRFERWRRDRPGVDMPSELILYARLYAMPPPDREPWRFDPPVEVPMARWRPGISPPPGMLPLEIHDPPGFAWLPVAP